jgi:hypothetical protein
MIQPALPLLHGSSKKDAALEPAPQPLPSASESKRLSAVELATVASPRLAELAAPPNGDEAREHSQDLEVDTQPQELTANPTETAEVDHLQEDETSRGIQESAVAVQDDSNNDGTEPPESVAHRDQLNTPELQGSVPTYEQNTVYEADQLSAEPGKLSNSLTYETSQYGQSSESDKQASYSREHSISVISAPESDYAATLNGFHPDHGQGRSHASTRSTEHDQLVSGVSNGSSNGYMAANLRDPRYRNGNYNSARYPPVSSLPPITEHLLQMSYSKEWTDWAIVVSCPAAPAFMSHAHGIMLLRSPRLRKMMERQPATAGGHILNLYSPLPIEPHAFDAALRFLYSDTVLTSESLFPDQPQARFTFLPYVLSYWMSGLIMGLEHVVTRSSKLLVDFLDWDIVEPTLKIADDLQAGASHDAPNHGNDWVEVASQWKALVLSFCANHMDPHSFQLDSMSPSNVFRPRFGALEDKSTSKPNPALATMVFGSMPTSANRSPATSPAIDVIQATGDMRNKTASHVLLNVDFKDLVYVYQQMLRAHGEVAMHILSAVVQEREARRGRVLANRAIPNRNRMANSGMWDLAAFREYLQDGELRRERVGFLMPAAR